MKQNQPACLYCKQQVDAAATRCPSCGAVIPREDIWPPSPIGAVQPVPKKPQLLTKAVWGDVVLGIGASIGLYTRWTIGVIAIPILYFLMRKKYPIFSRALGWCYIIPLILLGGILLVCVASGIYSKLGG